mgnify:CR=1 FL=1
MLIRSVNQPDNKSLSVILREVLVEMKIPQKGSAYEDPELDNMFEAYQFPRSKYVVVDEDKKILGGAGVSTLSEGDINSWELQTMYFHKMISGWGRGQ